MHSSSAGDRYPSVRLVLACAAPAIILALISLSPFLNKAFTNDDVTFLLQAHHVLTDPLHPTAFEMVFHGVRVRLSQALVTGPVMAYLLVPALLLGNAEAVAHGIQLALLCVGACAVSSISLRLGLKRAEASSAALLLAGSPAVLGMAATAMPDVAAMTFTALGVERFLAWQQGRSVLVGFIAAGLLAVAALSRPHALLVLPCLGLLVTPESSRVQPVLGRAGSLLRVCLASPLGITLVLVAIAMYVTRDPVSGDTLAQATARRVQGQLVVFNLVSMVLHWGLAFPLVLLWPIVRRGGLLHWFWTLPGLTGCLVLACAAGLVAPDRWWYTVPLGILAGVSATVLVDVLKDAWRRRDRIQGALGCWLLVPVATAAYVQLPAKVLLVSAPAMALLIARRSGIADGVPLSSMIVAAATALGTIVGLLVIRADAVMSQIGRHGGQVVAQFVSQRLPVWMDGAWGFQWYAMQAGAKTLAETPPFPRPGDIVVSGLRGRLVRTMYPHSTLLAQQVFGSPGGRVYGDGAGFFNNRAGLLPWVWGTGEIGRIEVWRIDARPTGGR